jgi:serine palmitoyltransferase
MAGATHDDPDLPWYQLVWLYFNFLSVAIFSYGSELVDKLKGVKAFQTKEGYSPLFKDWDSFWTRKIYRRISDCWNRPVSSCPGDKITISERVSDDVWETWRFTGEEKECLNLGSYNYLGFSNTSGPCLESVLKCIEEYGVSTTSTQAELGYTELHRELERKTAEFLFKEDCVIFGMGYATNSATVPVLAGKGCLIISDSLNHASLVHGCRSSGAKIKVFEHNNPRHLETVIREAIIKGQPRTHRPWRKIIIIVEGVYSMEGEICELSEIVRLKKKYKCYLWVDEAHSIGALGKTGRGVCEHAGVSTADVDILMGTYTKSFASVGGYITGTKELISEIRKNNFAQLYSTSMTTPCVQQSLTAMSIITGEDGTTLGNEKLKALRDNSNFFRNGLIERGFQVYGDKDSPVVPLMIYFPAKMYMFSRECLARGLAIVIVGFPATPLLMSRARFCISASHKIEDLKHALDVLDELGDRLLLKYE